MNNLSSTAKFLIAIELVLGIFVSLNSPDILPSFVRYIFGMIMMTAVFGGLTAFVVSKLSKSKDTNLVDRAIVYGAYWTFATTGIMIWFVVNNLR